MDYFPAVKSLNSLQQEKLIVNNFIVYSNQLNLLQASILQLKQLLLH